MWCILGFLLHQKQHHSCKWKTVCNEFFCKNWILAAKSAGHVTFHYFKFGDVCQWAAVFEQVFSKELVWTSSYTNPLLINPCLSQYLVSCHNTQHIPHCRNQTSFTLIFSQWLTSNRYFLPVRWDGTVSQFHLSYPGSCFLSDGFSNLIYILVGVLLDLFQNFSVVESPGN